MLKAKADGRKKHDDRRLREILGRTLDATLLHRRATMRYALASSQRTRNTSSSLQRIVYAHGGIYLVAWVPEYGQMRTFAAERIETFAPDGRDVSRPGPPTRAVRRLARCQYRRAGNDRPRVRAGGGALRPRTRVAPVAGDRGPRRRRPRPDAPVCNDYALLAWILGFGPDVRVSPRVPAETIFEAADRTRRVYARHRPEPRFSMLTMREAGKVRQAVQAFAKATAVCGSKRFARR